MADMNGHMGCVSPGSTDVDEAGGVPGACWFVAVVSHNGEHAVARRLGERGYVTYVASQREMRVWRDGRRKEVDRVVIPSTVFVRCAEHERRDVVKVQGVSRFLMNRAGAGGVCPAVVPDVQMDRLRFMLGATDRPVEFVGRPLRAGMQVRVVRGSLRGLVGEVVYGDSDSSSDGSSDDKGVREGCARVVIRLDVLGCAMVDVSVSDVESA